MDNDFLDGLIRPKACAFHAGRCVFQVCGCVGLPLAVLLAMTLTLCRSLSPAVMAAIILAAVLTFLVLVMATKAITGEEQIICYHHQIAVVTVAALLSWMLGQPILRYVDITIVGTGMFLGCGRIGCLMVGCCHGRPSRWGIRYGNEHAEAGFPSYLVGVRLFPIQAVESIFALCLVAYGTFLVLEGHPPGTALAFYVVGYAMGRFWIEFARGDIDRPYLWGFSEAQWISLLLAFAVAGAERARILRSSEWHLAAAIGLAVSMLLINLWRRFERTRRFELLHPLHTRELALALQRLAVSLRRSDSRSELNDPATRIRLAQTSLGIRISMGEIMEKPHAVKHYCLSKDDGVLSFETARILAHQIAHLEHAALHFKLVHGSKGVFHILFSLPNELS